MLRRWIGYGGLVLFALIFRVVYTDWLAGFVLAFVFLLPLAGLLVSIPAVWSTKVTLSGVPRELCRGERAGWVVKAQSTLQLPLGQIRAVVRVTNQLTREQAVYEERFFLSCHGRQFRHGGEALHCGLLQGELTAVWASDALGLFWLPLRKGPPAWQLIQPAGTAEVSPLPLETSPGMRPRPGGGPGEDYDPRAYRPGDPLHTIHWKLSAKRDELIVRETLEEIWKPPVLLFDHFGTAETMDRTLELLRSTGSELLQAGRTFDVAWVHAESGTLRRFSVQDEQAFRACLTAALSEPAPLTGKSILDAPQISGGVFLRPGEGEMIP